MRTERPERPDGLWLSSTIAYLPVMAAGVIRESRVATRILGDSVPLPHDLVIETTTRCNLRCLHCARSWEEIPARDMTRLVFRRIDPLLGGAGRVSLYGHGESLLHPRFLSMLRAVRNRGAPVHVVTNGTLITRELAEQLVAAQLDNLVFSVDAAHGRPFASLRRGTTLARVLVGAARVAAAKRRQGSAAPLLALQMVGMRSNVRELPYLISLGAAAGCDKIKMVALAEYGDMVGESLARWPEEAAPVRESLALAERLGIELEVCPSYLESLERSSRSETPEEALSPTPPPVRAFETRLCGDPWAFTYVTSRGEVTPCCGSSRVMGDLVRQDFGAVWRGAPYREFRRRLITGDLPEECRNCVLKPPLRLPGLPAEMRVGQSDTFPVPLLWGWHDREWFGGGAFRWTTPRAALVLRSGGARELTLCLLWPGGGEPPSGRVVADGETVTRYRLNDVGESEVRVPVEPCRDVTLLELVPDNPRRPVPSLGEGPAPVDRLPDRRVLGVGVRWIAFG